jgi:hypothetical protein
MLPSFRVIAVNTHPDSENRIHNDRVAAEYGFRGGLVPGVTVYGYLAAAAIDRLGPDWLHRGAMEVRFFEPYYDGDEVAVTVADLPDGKIQVESKPCATAAAWIDNAPPPDFPPEQVSIQENASRESMKPGTILGSFEKTLDLSQPGLSAPLDAFVGQERFAQPAIILGLANELLMRNYALGPWIHASSEVRNYSAVRDGELVQVRGKIIDAYERKGHEFVVLDVAILSRGAPVTRVRHTAIWKPRKI